MMSFTLNQVNAEEEMRLAYRVFDKDAHGNIPVASDFFLRIEKKLKKTHYINIFRKN
jgi:Ca2+-binding EF-hand superfamily protein